MYVVVDQNVLRKPELVQYLKENASNCCVLPDAAFLEMTKNEQWESTLVGSLSHLAQVPERVFAANAVSDALADELRTLKSVAGHMLWRVATKSVREVLHWVRTGTENATLLRMRQSPSHADAVLRSDYFSHGRNKESIGSLTDAVRRQLPAEFLDLLRKPATSNDDCFDAVHQIARSVAYGVLAERGVNKNRARSFISTRPLFYRYIILHAWYSLDWLRAGGLEAFKEENATNELIDHQYALTATFFDGLLSIDAKALRAYTALKSLLLREA